MTRAEPRVERSFRSLSVSLAFTCKRLPSRTAAALSSVIMKQPQESVKEFITECATQRAHTRVRVLPAIVRLAATCGGVKRLKNQFCWFLSEEMTHTQSVAALIS